MRISSNVLQCDHAQNRLGANQIQLRQIGQISRFCRSDLLRRACRPFAEVLISERSSIEDDFLPTPVFSETRRTGFSEIKLKSFSDFSDTSFADRFAGPIEHALSLASKIVNLFVLKQA
jgi:hypothetical protein